MDNEKATPTSLVVDASTSPVQVGIPALNGWKALHQVSQALEGLFSATGKVLEVSGYKISNINCVYFCEGPDQLLAYD